MNDLFGGWEIGCLGSGGSRREFTQRDRRRERQKILTEKSRNTEREVRRRRRRSGTEDRKYYGSKLIQ